MELSTIKTKLKDRLALGLNYGIPSLEEALADSSVLKNDMIAFRSQFNDLNRIASQGILGYEQVEIGYNKLRQGLLEIIDRIEVNDLADQKNLPKVQNRDLQHRKENFFELIKLHLNNLEAVKVRMTTSYGDERQTDERIGRDAMAMIYKDIFTHNFKFQRGGEKLDIQGFSRKFFDEYYSSLEVYMKTVSFILEYVKQEEVEQAFFQGVFRSLMSNHEVVLMVYYALSGIVPSFPKLLLESEIVEERHKSMLMEKTHFLMVEKMVD